MAITACEDFMRFVERCATTAANEAGAVSPTVPTTAGGTYDADLQPEGAMAGSVPRYSHWGGDQGG